MATKKSAQEATTPEVEDLQNDLSEDLQSYFNDQGYLPQTHEAYTALAVVEIEDNRFVVRQTDVIKGQVIAEHDSEPMLYEDAVETFKVAVAEFI